MSNYSDLTKAVMEGRRLMHAERVDDERPHDACVHTLQNQVGELQGKLAAEQAKHDETLDISEKLLAATNKLQCQLAEANEDKATLHVSLREAYTQLAEVIRERDALRTMLVVADARINRLVGNPK